MKCAVLRFTRLRVAPVLDQNAQYDYRTWFSINHSSCLPAMTTWFEISLLWSVIPAKLSRIKTRHCASIREPESLWGEMQGSYEMVCYATRDCGSRQSLIFEFVKLWKYFLIVDLSSLPAMTAWLWLGGAPSYRVSSRAIPMTIGRDPRSRWSEMRVRLWNALVLLFTRLRVAPEFDHGAE